MLRTFLFLLIFNISLFSMTKEEEFLDSFEQMKVKNVELLNNFEKIFKINTYSDIVKSLRNPQKEKITIEKFFVIINKYSSEKENAIKYNKLAGAEIDKGINLLNTIISSNGKATVEEIDFILEYLSTMGDYTKKFQFIGNSITSKLSTELITTFSDEALNEILNIDTVKQSQVINLDIGIPNKENLSTIEKKQNFLTDKDGSITFIYSLYKLPIKKSVFDFSLVSPSGKIASSSTPLEWEINETNNYIFEWYWNLNYIDDLKSEKGTWKVTLVIDGKEISTNTFEVR